MKLTDRLKEIDKEMKLSKSVSRGLKKGLGVSKKGLKLAGKGLEAIQKELSAPVAPQGTDPTPKSTSVVTKSTELYDRIPMPPPPDDGQYDVKYFTPWVDALEADWKQRKPSLETSFQQALDTVEASRVARDSIHKTLDHLKKQKDPPASEEAIKDATGAAKAADDSLDEDVTLLQTIAESVVGDLDLVSESFDDANLLTLFVLKSATLPTLEEWCARSESDQHRIISFLGDVSLMKKFLAAGGPYSFNKLDRALEIYHELLDSQDLSDPVLERIALAVSLELCVDVILFGQKEKTVDPIQRYVHYSQAYLLGELDPVFPSFTAWELRMVVDSDAPDDQLGWGRQCLQNYRPDICSTNLAEWRYCRIVRTDVPYQAPHWYKPTPSYDQILSGGGKCGPRAWYGRFACKSFGIPTWGVKQPGHAAVSRWTKLGHWVTVLGGGIWKSYWPGRAKNVRCGLDFFLEVDARIACSCEEDYLTKVERLEWMAFLENESDKSIRQGQHPLPSSSSPWYALSMMQRCNLAANDKGVVKKLPTPAKKRQTKLETLLAQPDEDPPTALNDDGEIIIPAASFSKSSKATVMKSFLGGQQILLTGDGGAEYEIPASLVSTALDMKLSILVCSVHRSEQPLTLTVTAGDAASTVTQIEVPYTMGYWSPTEEVQLPTGTTKIQISRVKQSCGISLKELTIS